MVSTDTLRKFRIRGMDMKLYDDLQKYHNYTDYQIKLVQYALKSLANEVSKFIILGVFFLIMGKLPEFLVAALLLLFFRRYNGGLHCNTYVTCLLATFLYFFASVLALPLLISVPYALSIVVLAALTILIPMTAPVKSKYHAELEPGQIKRYRGYTLAVMIGILILYCVFPKNHFVIVGFWVTVVHAFQLTIAYIKKRRCRE